MDCSELKLEAEHPAGPLKTTEPAQINSDCSQTYQQVSGDQNSTGTRAKLPHDQVSLLLVHVAVLEEELEAEVKDAAEPDADRQTVAGLPEQRR